MLNIPLRGDGTMDEMERSIVDEIGQWMRQNGNSIYGTRPWKIFGEGPAQAAAAALSAQGFNEGKGKPFSAEDIRFAIKGDALYATVMATPVLRSVLIKSLAADSSLYPEGINKVELVANQQPLDFTRTREGLRIRFPESVTLPLHAIPLKIT